MKFSLTLSTLALLGLSQTVFCQSAPVTKKPAPGILGYLDAKTGAFRPLRQEAPDAALVPNTAATTGKFVFTFTIAIQSTIATSVPISCEATATVDEVNSTTYASRLFEETSIVTATRSGNTATCTVTIPYSWALATASSDTVGLTYTIYAESTSAPFTDRMTYQDLPSIKVPASGATTTEAVSVTI